MNLKDLFKAAHQAGNDGIDFESWFDRWSDDPDFIESVRIASSDYKFAAISKMYERDVAPFGGKNIISPGSNIVCGGNFHLGDK